MDQTVGKPQEQSRTLKKQSSQYAEITDYKSESRKETDHTIRNSKIMKNTLTVLIFAVRIEDTVRVFEA